MQSLEGVTPVGEAPSMEEALELARRSNHQRLCVGAVRSDRPLPKVEPREAWGSPSGGWRKANESRKERDRKRRGDGGKGLWRKDMDIETQDEERCIEWCIGEKDTMVAVWWDVKTGGSDD